MSDRPDSTQTVKALLGPGGHELTCEECFDLLDKYVEVEEAGEDADRAVPGMRAHLEGCPACSEDHASLRALLQSQVAFPKAPLGE